MLAADIAALKARFTGREWPVIQALHPAPNSVVIDLTVVPTLSWFVGHFPSQPVLPGIVQTHWAGSFGQTLFALADRFSQAQNLKFQSMMLPNTDVQLRLELAPGGDSLKFSYRQDTTLYSEGRLDFALG